MRHEATRADDTRAMEIFDRQRSGDLVMARRNPQRLVLIDACGAVRCTGRTKAMIERGLQCSGFVGRAVANGSKPAVFHAHSLVIGKQ